MENLRQRLAADPKLYPELAATRIPQGSKHNPVALSDSDDEDAPARMAGPSNAPPAGAWTSQGILNAKTSANAMRPSYPTPIPVAPQMQMPIPRPYIHPVPAASAYPVPGAYAPSPAFPVVASAPTPQNGEDFNLAKIAPDPMERRKTVDETQKQLMDLVESAFGDDTPIDMSRAEVEGFADGWTLKPHQVQAREWMKERESGKKVGGILGDMGLGKTCQIICRVVDYQNEEDDEDTAEQKKKDKKKYGKSTLVVVPNAVAEQWAAEVKKITKSLKVMVHHGPSRTKKAEDFKKYDVVVTTYGVMGAEHTNLPEAGADAKKEDKDDDSEDELIKKLNSRKAKAAPKKHTALYDASWLRIVLDEAHTIKNAATVGAKSAWALKGKYRWCLTGTPIQNKVDDFYPLIRFLGIRPLNDIDVFKAQIVKPLKDGRSTVPMKRLHVVLQAIMLRRKKDQIINGKPIVDLPGRTVSLVECDFDADEQEFYTAMVERTELTLNKFARQGTLNNNFASMLVLLLRLRQACCHPQLCTKAVKDDIAALEPKAKVSEKEGEEDEEADVLADMFGKLGVKEAKCEICQDILPSGWRSKNCSDCELTVVRRVRKRQSDAAADIKPGHAATDSSAKIRKLLELLRKIADDSEGQDKVIVFSQFTSFLDIVQTFLNDAGLKYVRYDGSMKMDERTEALDKFRSSKQRNIALISFKAGSTGLNLTAANHVILLDLWWNPALEDQAFDRAHRYGQTKDVFIYKLMISGTVETRIQELQDKKRELATNALTGAKLGKSSGLRMDDLMRLFTHDHGHDE